MDPNQNLEPGFEDPSSKNPLDKIKKLFAGIPGFLKKLWAKMEGLVPEKLLQKINGFLPSAARPLFERYGRKILVGLVVFIFLLFLKSCFFGHAKPKESLRDMVDKQKAAEDTAIPVKGFKVGRFNFEDSLNALGTIKGAVEFKLSFEVPGVVSSINYREGERYEEGALLISLKQDDILLRLKRAQAEFNKAEAQSKIAGQKFEEHQKLLAMGAIPKSTLDNVKLELDSSQYEMEAARLEVKANEAMLEKSNLYAPSAGMIGELNIEEGETVTPNTMLGTHVNTEYVFAEFGIVEREVNKIALGQKARVFVDAYPDKTFEGVIENISPVVAGTSRTATARVRIENPERLLLPGMFARVRILLYSKKNTLVVPTDAIQGGEGEQFVYVIEEKSKQAQAKAAKGEGGQVQPAAADQAAPAVETAPKKSKKEKKKSGKDQAPAVAAPAPEEDTVRKRPITVGYKRPDYCQIDAGLSEGEVVAVSSLERLDDGKKIRVLEIQEAEI